MATSTLALPRATEGVYVAGTLGQRLLNVPPDRLKELAGAGRLRIRRITGAHPAYCLADLLRLAAEAEQTDSGPRPAA